MSVGLKICGIMDQAALDAACGVDGGGAADFVGFVFVNPDRDPSRHIVTPEQARPWVLAAQGHRVKTVGLFVEPTDEEIDVVLTVAPVDVLQLHGTETPERVRAIKARTGKKIIKAFHIETCDDFARVAAYDGLADWYLFDTKTRGGPKGGTGKSFNWDLMKGRTFAQSWFLAGGLGLQNIQQAVAQTGASMIDLSSGAETEGRKDPETIRKIISMARRLSGAVM